MKVVPDAAGIARLHARNDAAGKAALDDCQAVAAGTEARVTGEMAASIKVDWHDGKGRLYSDLPQAGAVERGANVGNRRGPHMTGNHRIATAGGQWPANVTRHLAGRP